MRSFEPLPMVPGKFVVIITDSLSSKFLQLIGLFEAYYVLRTETYLKSMMPFWIFLMGIHSVRTFKNGHFDDPPPLTLFQNQIFVHSPNKSLLRLIANNFYQNHDFSKATSRHNIKACLVSVCFRALHLGIQPYAGHPGHHVGTIWRFCIFAKPV